MGKVVKAVAVIATAAAIAYFAPYLSSTVLGFVGTSATIASAAISATLALAATAALKALIGPPSATIGLHRGSLTTQVETKTSQPRGETNWRNPLFFPGARFAIEPITGECMLPVVSKQARWMVIDRQATVRAGDLIVIRVGDQRQYYLPTWQALSLTRLVWAAQRIPMVKRFVGIGHAKLLFEHTNPRVLHETDLATVDLLYRVRALAPSLWHACTIWWRMRRDPSLFDTRLATAQGNERG